MKTIFTSASTRFFFLTPPKAASFEKDFGIDDDDDGDVDDADVDGDDDDDGDGENGSDDGESLGFDDNIWGIFSSFSPQPPGPYFSLEAHIPALRPKFQP